MSSYDYKISSNDSCGSSRCDPNIEEDDWDLEIDNDDLSDFTNKDRPIPNAVELSSVLDHETREELTTDPALTNDNLPSFYEKYCTCMPCRPILNVYPKIVNTENE